MDPGGGPGGHRKGRDVQGEAVEEGLGVDGVECGELEEDEDEVGRCQERVGRLPRKRVPVQGPVPLPPSLAFLPPATSADDEDGRRRWSGTTSRITG